MEAGTPSIYGLTMTCNIGNETINYTMLHHAEFDLGGFLLPWIFVVGMLEFMVAWVITAVMESF